MNQRRIITLLLCLIFALSGCAMPSDSSPPGKPQSQSPSPPASFTGSGRTAVLIFAGASSWTAEVNSLASLLYNHTLTYREVSSSQLDAMSLDELSSYALLIIPGGDAPTITASLSAETHARLREAVQKRGISYLGFCAGAWLAFAPAPAPGKDVTYGIGIVDGPIQLPNYLTRQGKEFEIVTARFADGTRRSLLWYGGPITPELPGGVVARYPDGTPAITQAWSGEGFVIVSGLHPTANDYILAALELTNRDAIAPDLAWKLIDSAIHRQPMPAY